MAECLGGWRLLLGGSGRGFRAAVLEANSFSYATAKLTVWPALWVQCVF